MNAKRITMIALLATAMGATACKGDKGDAGGAGATGPTGPAGASNGILQGTLTYTIGATSYPATGVPVTFVPDVGISPTPTTDASGNYQITVPVGTYSVVFDAAGANFTKMQVDGVGIAAGFTTALSKVLTLKAPFAAVAASNIPNPAGFNKSVTLGLTLKDKSGTAITDLTGYTFAWSKVNGPTSVTLSGANTATPSFTTGSVDAIANTTTANSQSGKILGLELPSSKERPGFIAVTTQQLRFMTYNFKCTVTNPQGYKTDVTVGVAPATMTQAALNYAPLGLMIIANDQNAQVPANTWTLALAGGTAPTLEGADTKNPYFVPVQAGSYTLTVASLDSAGAPTTTTLAVTVGTFKGNSPSCGTCHTGGGPGDTKVKGIYAEWVNSAHGNHWFKFETVTPSYDLSGALTGFTTSVKTDPATGKPFLGTTADTSVFWDLTAMTYTPARPPMTTFQFGITRAEGSHYGANCIACHTTGYNATAAAVNGGFDDVAKTSGWSFPALADPVPKAPDYTAWDAMPAAVKALAGMQCESCHGPLSQHNNVATAPKAVFNVSACSGCHDALGHHDRFELWALKGPAGKGHSNLELAVSEGPATSSSRCGKCHSAQGFVQWADAGFVSGSSWTPWNPPTAAVAEPITCQGCHDPHKTATRTPASIAMNDSGFSVTGQGEGTLCQLCHQGRRGVHDDSAALTSYSMPHAGPQSDVLNGKNFYFMGSLAADPTTMSKHAVAVEDSCVGCHMTFGSDYVKANIGASNPSNTNHSFQIDQTVCSNCHGSVANGEALKANVEAAIAAIRAANGTAATLVNKYVADQLAVPANVFVRAYDPVSECYSSYAASPSTPDSNVQISAAPGAANVVLADGVRVKFNNVSITVSTWFTREGAACTNPPSNPLTTLTFGIDSMKDAAQGANIVPANSNLVKGMWNMAMIDDDASGGAHNPSFVLEAIAKTQANIGL